MHKFYVTASLFYLILMQEHKIVFTRLKTNLQNRLERRVPLIVVLGQS